MINALAGGLAGMNAMQSVVNTQGSKIAQQSSAIGQAAADSPSSVVTLSGGSPAVQGGGQSGGQSGSQLSAAAGDALANSMVGMNEAVLMYKANASTVRAADAMMGTLLDIRS